MGKRTGKRSYQGLGDVWVLVNGFDDLRTGAKATDAKNVEVVPRVQAGSVLHCAIVLRASELPPPVPAHVKIKLKSKYLCHKRKTVEKTDDIDGEVYTRTSEESFYEEVKWFEHSVLVTAHPVPGTGVVDHTGYYRVDYVVTWQVPPEICASMDMKRERLSFFSPKKQAFKVYYTLRAKLFYDGYPLAYKGEKRAVQILASVPKPVELMGRMTSRSQPGWSWKDKNFGPTKVNVKAQPDQLVFYEGGILSVTATIENQSTGTVNAGKLNVIENIDYDALHIENGPQKVEFKSDICSGKLLGLDIGPKKCVERSFAVRLPRKIFPPSTRLSEGIHRMYFDHYAILQLSGPGLAKPPKIVMSVVIATRNVQAVQSPPIFPPPPGAPMPPAPSPLPADARRAFVVFVKAAYNLPKMDSALLLGRKANPFLRILVNDRHYRCTPIKKGNLNPEWGEEFQIFLTEEEQKAPPKIEVCCFDYEFWRKNKVIGIVQGGIDAVHENSGQFRMYGLTDEKKSATRNRGRVELSYTWT